MSEKLSFITKFYYGFGSMAYGIKDNAFSYFLLFVYVQVFGLAPDLAGLAIFVMLIFDAISDPLIGYFSDRTRSRWGRRHPFMYFSAIPVGLSFFLLWDPPSNLSQNELFFYLLFLGIFIRTAITFYEIPSAALGPELSKDYVERSSLMSFRYWFGWWGGLSVWNSLWIFVVYASWTGSQDARYIPETWAIYGLTCSVIMVISIMVTSLGTHKKIPNLYFPPPRNLSLKETFAELYETMTISRDYVILFIAMIVTGIAGGIATNFALFLYSFFWEFTPLNILTIGLTLFLTPLVGLKMSPLLAEKIGKRESVIYLSIGSILAENTVIILRLLDFLPENGNPSVLAFVLIFHWFAVACAIIAGTTLASMVFDTVEEVEKATGRRMEGTLFAARSFAAKCMSGSGAFIAGLILSYAQWPKGAIPGQVPYDTLFTIGLCFACASISLWALAIFILSKVSMSKEKHQENLKTLKYLDTSE
ncbi:MAG: MFS transporter [Pseudomonadota bacterium]|nr:MFS transporter [Pseudomonadota bacterium]